MMEDGVLTAPAPYASPAAYYRPSVGRMHAVEVLKGSSQIRCGPHTTGGVVDFVSTPIPAGPKGHFRGLYGEGNEMRAHGYWGNTIEGFARHSNGFERIDGAPEWMLLGGVHNVTDEEYLASRHPHGPRPGQPRFAFVGLELTS